MIPNPPIFLDATHVVAALIKHDIPLKTNSSIETISNALVTTLTSASYEYPGQPHLVVDEAMLALSTLTGGLPDTWMLLENDLRPALMRTALSLLNILTVKQIIHYHPLFVDNQVTGWYTLHTTSKDTPPHDR